MDSKSMGPQGLALLDYLNGKTDGILVIRRDDGKVRELPISIYFGESSTFHPQVSEALGLCFGYVLDIGAGAGQHSLELQKRGLRVFAIDISAESCVAMKKNGVLEVVCADFFDFRGGPFDTLLLLGRSIGMVEDLGGLSRFFSYATKLTDEGSQILLNSLDVTTSFDSDEVAYQQMNQERGHYIGENRFSFEYGTKKSKFKWLYIDPGTLAEYAQNEGWRSEVIRKEDDGNYLARLTRK